MLSERALSSTDSLTDRSDRPWVVRGFGKSQGQVTAGKQGGCEVGGGVCGRTEEGWGRSVLDGVCSHRETRKDICSFTKLTVVPPVLPSLVSGVQASLIGGDQSLKMAQGSFWLVME